MDSTALKKEIESALQADGRLWHDGALNQTLLLELLEQYDEGLLGALLSRQALKDKFFVSAREAYVFKISDFRFFMEENRVDNSCTAYKNRIGLTDGRRFLKDTNDVVLDFPYKDCVLAGGQSTEEGTDTYYRKNGGDEYEEMTAKRKEVFFNQVLAHDEIDRLLDPKAFVGWKRFNKKGEQPVKALKRDEQGVMRENMIIKGNNLLALHSLKRQFAGKVKLVYIDPPYNTGGDANIFTYNNNFNHSAWLTFMKNRLEAARELLREDGFIAIAIDHCELFYLGALADEIFGRENRLGIITVVHQARGRNMDKGISVSNEFMLVYSKTEGNNIKNVVIDDEKKQKFHLQDEKGSYYLKNFIMVQGGAGGATKQDRPKNWYPVYVSPDLQNVSLEAKDGYEKVLPSTDKRDLTWITKKETFLENFHDNEIVIRREDSKVVIYRKFREQQIVTTHWAGAKYNATSQGTLLLEKIIGRRDFSYPKSLYTVVDTLKLMTDPNDIVLDFHAGSGTTGHAVLALNKEDGGRRTFILVEQLDEHIDICIERNQKVIKQEGIDSSFVYCEIAKWNEFAKEAINACGSLEQLTAFFKEMSAVYFLNYNLKVKEFSEQVINEDKFIALPLEEQKKVFLAMLDLNQMYVNRSEMADAKYAVSDSDQKLTSAFYQTAEKE